MPVPGRRQELASPLRGRRSGSTWVSGDFAIIFPAVPNRQHDMHRASWRGPCRTLFLAPTSRRGATAGARALAAGLFLGPGGAGSRTTRRPPLHPGAIAWPWNLAGRPSMTCPPASTQTGSPSRWSSAPPRAASRHRSRSRRRSRWPARSRPCGHGTARAVTTKAPKSALPMRRQATPAATMTARRATCAATGRRAHMSGRCSTAVTTQRQHLAPSTPRRRGNRQSGLRSCRRRVGK